MLVALSGCADRVILEQGLVVDTDGETDGMTETDTADDDDDDIDSTGDPDCTPGTEGCPCPEGQIPSGGTCVPSEVEEIEAVVPVDQQALAGDFISEAPAVRLLSGGAPVAGVPVTFSAAGLPGGVLGTVESVTDADGIASAQSWELGKLDGSYFVRAQVPSLPDVGFVDFTGRTISDFEIQLEYVQPATESQTAAFETARLRWQGALINALPTIAGDLGDFGPNCGVFGPSGTASVTGVLIFVQLQEIDGPGGDNGNILGQAGPCALRDDGSPFLGVMTFDTFDLDALESEGSLETVILHEMGHVLGVGTLWQERGLLLNPSVPDNAGADTHFIGPAATEVFLDLLGGQFFDGSIVPVENNAQPGSSDGHWRETVVVDELMSPRLGGIGEVAPLSILTISGLGDHGYYVPNVLAADDWTLPARGLVGPGPERTGHVGTDTVVTPRWKLDANGNWTPL